MTATAPIGPTAPNTRPSPTWSCTYSHHPVAKATDSPAAAHLGSNAHSRATTTTVASAVTRRRESDSGRRNEPASMVAIAFAVTMARG